MGKKNGLWEGLCPHVLTIKCHNNLLTSRILQIV